MNKFSSNLSKLLTSVVGINIILSLSVVELFSRFYYHYKNHYVKSLPLTYSPELRKYLSYVNHYRDNSFPEKTLALNKKYKNKLKPLNANESSFYIYSLYSDCVSDRKSIKTNRSKNESCNTFLFQGDSFGVGVGANASDIIFDGFAKKGWRTINGSSSSFSPANHSGQLAYFNSKEINPKIIVSLIDQGDIGDDYLRYRSNTIYETKPIRHYKVKPFLYKHRRFYNYGPYLHPSSIFSPFPLTPRLVNNLYTKLSLNLFYATDGKFDFTKTPGWSKISQPLMKEDKEANNFFSDVLSNYIKTAEDIGTQEIFFISVPHPRHIVKTVSPERKYTYSVKTILNQVVQKHQSLASGIKVRHLAIDVDKKKYPCLEETCAGFYIVNGHHPSEEGFRYIAGQIKDYLESNSQHYEQ